MLENIDCLAHMLSYLTVRERECCRAVCLNWLLSADELARTQQTLVIVGQQKKNVGNKENLPGRQNFRSDRRTLNKSSNSTSQTITWPQNYIRYHCFCQMLERFPNVQSITFEGIEHWNDHLLHQLTTACPRLRELAFIRCVGLGRSRLHEKDYMNVTLRGWNRLVEAYGTQLIHLTLTDCDLDDQQLAIVVGGFRSLRYLDLSSNRMSGEALPLRDLPTGLVVLKVGPRLVGSNVTASIPIEPILEGAGKYVRELHLQGFLSSHLERVAEMQCLEKLSIRFMKPLFEDGSDSGRCFAAIGRLPTLKCLEIYQHNTHDCYMALSRDHLLTIFTGCPLLSRLVLNCDIWCDSPVDDQLLGHLRRCCPLLEHLDLCPGNYQTTDASLAVLASFPRLRTLRIVEFSGITEAGLMAAIRSVMASLSGQLVNFTVEDCCDIDVRRVMDCLRMLHAEQPHRRFELTITPLRSLQVPTQVHFIPDDRRPVIRLTICGQKGVGDNSQGSGIKANLVHFYRHLIGLGPGKRLGEHYIELVTSASSLLSFFAQSALSVITFLSTLLTFGAACCVYLLHLVLLNVPSCSSVGSRANSPATIRNPLYQPHHHPVHLLLGISFLSPGTIFCLSALFIGPVLYVISSLLAMIASFTTSNGHLEDVLQSLLQSNL